jgi:hypothetical protein
MAPDPWQTKFLTSTANQVMLCCSRQVGKTQVTAALALRMALLKPESLILVVSRGERQAEELIKDKIKPIYRRLGSPGNARVLAGSLEFTNGSRIIALPGKQETIVGFSSVDLLILDEAARIPDGLYYDVRPFLAVSQGRLFALSSPFGQRGWFYEAWRSTEPWERYEVKASQCPRLTSDFLKNEREALGPRWYAQNYDCSFEAETGSIFDPLLVDKMFETDEQPLIVD